MPQTEVPIERRFHGSVNLVILHLLSLIHI